MLSPLMWLFSCISNWNTFLDDSQKRCKLRYNWIRCTNQHKKARENTHISHIERLSKSPAVKDVLTTSLSHLFILCALLMLCHSWMPATLCWKTAGSCHLCLKQARQFWPGLFFFWIRNFTAQDGTSTLHSDTGSEQVYDKFKLPSKNPHS